MYSVNKLHIDKKKSIVIIMGSESQLRTLNLDDFTIFVDVDKPLLAG